MSRKTGRKWKTEKCGRCGDPHSGYSGKLNAEGKEYVVCGPTGKPMLVNPLEYGSREMMFITEWILEK